MKLRVLAVGILAAVGGARAADIEFVTQELPWAIADKPYSPPPLEVRSSGACGAGGVGFSVVGGVLPPGLTFSKQGYFGGVPLRTGEFGFAIRVTNGCTWTAKRFTITVTGVPVISVDPKQIAFEGAGEKLLRVSGTWPRLSYQVMADADWLKLSPAHGFTPRAASALTGDDVIVTADPRGLKPGHYKAKITIAAWQALEVRFVDVELEITGVHEPTGSPTSGSRP